MTKIMFSGKVESGSGIGKHFISLPWVKKQIKEFLGFSPYPGTLNLKINEATTNEYQEFLKERKFIKIKPVNSSFHPGFVVKAKINNFIDGAIVIPIIDEYPKNLVEIISSVYLREALTLKDGYTVNVIIR